MLLTGTLAAQDQVTPPAEKRARALVNQLELAERRAAAAEELLALGAAGVPALVARLQDPRPEVLQVVCEVLTGLGPLAASALPQLDTAAKSPDAALVRMLRLTELRLRATGMTTLCEYEGKRIVQIAADGSERELLADGNPWGFDLLPDGHLLVTHYATSKVAEYDAKGTELWSFTDLKMPLDADRLLDGRTLIADTYGGRVIEVDAKGEVVWQWLNKTGKGNPYDVERLANGRTLVALYPDQVLELDRMGNVAWRLEGLEGVFDADRLPNGNTLLALFGAQVVREVNAKGKTVWQAKVALPNDADRLPSGNTLVGTADGLLEVAPDGKVVSRVNRRGRVSGLTRH